MKFLILLLTFSSPAFAKERGTLIKALSGDKVQVKVLNKTQECRLSGIIAPNGSIKEGKESKESLERYKNQVVIMEKTDKGCALFLGGVVDLAKNQLEWGKAWINYKTINSSLKESYEQAQEVGKVRKVGIWVKPLKAPLESQKNKKSLGNKRKEN